MNVELYRERESVRERERERESERERVHFPEILFQTSRESG